MIEHSTHRQKLNNTCLPKSLNQKQKMQESPPITSFLNIRQQYPMSTPAKKLSAGPAAAPAMEGVVVNSIIYSKPSFCSIVMDIAPEMAGLSEQTSKKEQFMPPKIAMPLCAGKLTNVINNLASAANAMTTHMSSDHDARFYMMCTTMNGVINHQISEIYDDLMAMGLFSDSQSECEDPEDDDDDNDSLVEFAYGDEEIQDDASDLDDEDEDDFYNPENKFEIKTANCDKFKKVSLPYKNFVGSEQLCCF